MKKIISKILNIIFYFFKIKNNQIIFEGARNLIDENPKAIYLYIKKFYSNSYKTIWLLSKKTDTSILPKNDFAYYNTFKGLYYFATSKYIINSQSIGNILKKKKNQIYIQTWHGYGPSKKMGYDLQKKHPNNPMNHVKEWDYFICSSNIDKKIIKSSTGYNKKTCLLGSATTDLILEINNNTFKKNIIKNKIKIPTNFFNKKIILYAPSFRNNNLQEKTIKLKINKLFQLNNYIILIRLHPLIKEKLDKSIFSKNIIDVSNYPDSSELLGITDILISDYSSISFKFAILNKPIIFYAFDLDLYLKERGFYLNYTKTMPGIIVYNEDDLLYAIKNIKEFQAKYIEKLNTFNKKYNYLNDGNVCKRIVNKLNEGFFS